MKKPGFQLLAAVTCVFLALILGFFAGRNFSRTPVQIQSLSPSPQTTVPTEETEAVPEQTERLPGISQNTAAVNINTATAEQLQTLPGIGQVLAERIIAYRDANGGFSTVGELAMVEGIGEKKLEALWKYATAGG